MNNCTKQDEFSNHFDGIHVIFSCEWLFTWSKVREKNVLKLKALIGSVLDERIVHLKVYKNVLED